MADIPAFDPNQPFQSVDDSTPAQSKPAFDPSQPHEALDASASADSSKPAFDPNQPFESSEDKYGSAGQQAIAGLEGAARGATFGLSTGVETKLLGIKPEDIIGRQEENPVTSGVGEAAGVIGSAFIPVVGEGNILARVGQGAAEAANLGKVGSAVIKGAVETGLFQGGDEISKAMLGQGDPNAPVSAALAHMGAAALLGGVTGGVFGSAAAGLAKLADTKVGSRLADFAEDFGNRWKFNQENPNPVDAVTKELQDFHATTGEAADEVYGPTGLKTQAIEKLVPQMNEAIQNQNQEIADTLQSKLTEMAADTESYPARLTKKLQSDVNAWMDVATNPQANSNEVFNATQNLKQMLQAYSKFDKMVGPLSPEKDFINVAKELQNNLVSKLEDTKVWGDAGKLQQNINKAFREYLPALKDFESRFTTKVTGEPVLDPGKVNTYMNQLGKPSAVLKQGMLGDYIDAAEKYRNKISDLHTGLGVESPIKPASLNATKGTLINVQSAGAKLADMLSGQGDREGIVTHAADVAASLGHGFGGHFAVKAIAPILEKAIGRPLNKMAAAAIIKTLSTQAYKNAPEALAHAAIVDKGAMKISDAIGALFKIGGAKELDFKSSEKDREKLRKFVEKGGVNQQMQNTLNQQNRQVPPPAQRFAEGGAVEAPVQPTIQADTSSGLSTVYPDQDMLLNSAKGRIYNYLNAQRPQEVANKLPFDTQMPDKTKARAYDKALDIANQPLSVLQHVQDGTLTPIHMQHFTQMYPELYSHLSKKITEKVMQSQMDESKPSYSVRQGLSLFLGAPLDSSFTPASIQAAQSVYAQQASQPAPNTPVTKNKRNTSTLNKMADSHFTNDQARADRQAKA